MPCIFCIAVFTILAGSVTTAILDELEARLAASAASPVRRGVDSASVTKLEFDFPVPRTVGAGPPGGPAAVPVALTVYKQHRRVRIQVLTHDISRERAEALEDRIAELAGLTIVGRSDAHSERKVREAVAGEHAGPVGDPARRTEPGVRRAGPWPAGDR